MNLKIPSRAFFSFAWTCPYRKDPPVIDGDVNDWGASSTTGGFRTLQHWRDGRRLPTYTLPGTNAVSISQQT